MQNFQISDAKEHHKAKMAQLKGRTGTLVLGGETVYGSVVSIVNSSPDAWTVKLRPVKRLPEISWRSRLIRH